MWAKFSALRLHLRPPCLPPKIAQQYINIKLQTLDKTAFVLSEYNISTSMPLHPWYSTTNFYQPSSSAVMGSIELPTRLKASFPVEANSEEYAKSLDAKSPLKHLRDDFVIPTKKSLKTKTAKRHGIFSSQMSKSHVPNFHIQDESSEQSIYFCGNSLGLQPKATRQYLDAHLNTWGAIGVNGHFTDLEESPLTQWQSYAEHAAALSAPIVGAKAEEVAVMGSLTMNLHLLMASFYKPTATRYKIILEWKAFPSDHVSFAIPSLFNF